MLTGLAVERWGLGIIFAVAAAGFALAALLAIGLAPAVTAAAERPLRAGLRVFRTRYLALFLVGMLFASASMSAGLDFLTPRFDELGAPAGLIGFSWALAAAVEVPVMLAFPALARRFSGTRLLVAGAVIIALRTGISAIATDPVVLVVASGLGGVGYALYTVGGVTFVANHVPPALAATGQGIFQGATLGLSGVLAAAVGGVVAGALGIAGMFAVAGVVGLAAAIVVAIAVLRPGRQQPPGRQ
jgi:PPP family 3-phenylpropionic acid transporter